MEKLDIKSLAKELKLDAIDAPPKGKTKSKPGKQPRKSPKANGLDAIISEVNEKEGFDTNACVYIDSEIHDVLRRLKARTKLRIGPFISWMLEGFIQEHKEEIAGLLKPTANRFIDK